MDILITKYLRALISYEGIQRIESLPMPREALREALLNCVVHKAYESLTPIQIAVYDNKLEIWNCGVLPEDWKIGRLKIFWETIEVVLTILISLMLSSGQVK